MSKVKSWQPVFRFLKKSINESATISKNKMAIETYNAIEAEYTRSNKGTDNMAMTVAERKKAQRDREQLELETIGATNFTANLGIGTYAALDRIVEHGGFESHEEAFNVIIHTADKSRERDSHIFDYLVDVKNIRR
jgi:hypothetical protein